MVLDLSDIIDYDAHCGNAGGLLRAIAVNPGAGAPLCGC
jgi:hypothetical protein